MRTRVFDEATRRLGSVLWLVCVVCATVVVPSVNTVAIEEGLGEERKPSEQDVEGTRMRVESLGSPYWVNTRLPEEPEESIAEGAVLFSTDECSRYCIERNAIKNEDSFQYINFFWFTNGTDTISDNFLPKDYQQLITPGVTWTENQKPNSSKDCQIYLDLDCDDTNTGTDTNYMKKSFYPSEPNNQKDENIFNKPLLQSPIKLVEKFNLSKNTEMKFTVDRTTPRIVINVDGNVSKALLRVPINATVPLLGTVISWRRKGDADGVRIDTRDAPPGEWWVKLTGEDNSNYHFTAKGFAEERKNEAQDKLFSPEDRTEDNINELPESNYHSHMKIKNYTKLENETTNDFPKTSINSEVIESEPHHLDAVINSKLIDNDKITSKRSLGHQFGQERNDRATVENLNYDASTENNVIPNYVEYVTFAGDDNDVTTSSDNSNTNDETLDTMLLLKEQEKIYGRSSIGVTGDVDVDNIRTSILKDVKVSMKMVETLDNQELSQDLVTYGNENSEGKKMLIEVNRNSNLLVTPGTIHRIVFDVKNSCVLPVRYAFRVKSTSFRVVGLQPSTAWIYPGQMSNVAVDLVIPDNAAPDTANTVTLFIPGTEIKEKSAYLYVQGSLSKLTDDVKPKIEYSFNNNCAGKLGKNYCYKSYWSADITIQDYDSGLKRVISSPNEIYPRTEFVSGTRSPVTFYYSATCCDTTAKITAVDLLDNYDTYTVDVTVWNNLSEAQIATITLGVLFGLLLIVMIVILILYCFQSRKSHDLPYTQRYGSRSPPRSERTSS